MQNLTPTRLHTPPSIEIVLSEQASDHLDFSSETPLYSRKLFRSREQPILRHNQKTNPIIRCAAILCMIFCLLVIFLGIATLIIFLVVKPRTPQFDMPGASLSVTYFDSPQFLNSNLTFLANFSNPNRKLNVRFEYLHFKLYFSEKLVASQVLQPISQKPGEARLIPIHLASSAVYLPPNLALELSKQAQRNRVSYNIKGTFRVRVKLGIIHYSYWLHDECQLEMTGPPIGILVAHSCRTKR